MLSGYKRNQAVEIAQVLAMEGMLFGQELEEYIRLDEMDGLIELKDDERDEFIDEVIKAVEKQWKKAVAVYDKKDIFKSRRCSKRNKHFFEQYLCK